MKLLRVLAGALALTTVLCSCGTTTATTTTAAGTAVETQTVTRSHIASQSQLSGKVVPYNEVSILPPISAKVLSVSVKVGDHVTKGQTLFQVDPSNITRDITPIAGERSRTAALYDAQIAQAQKSLSDTKTLMAAQVRQAQQNADNTRALYATGAASSIDVQNTADALTQAKLSAQQSIAQAELSVQQLQTTKANALATYDKNIQDLQKNVSDTTVTATADGVVTSVSVVQGSMASPQSTAVTIATNAPPQVLVSVSEEIQPWLSLGQTIPVTISALGSATISAHVASIAPSVDSETQLYDVRLNLPADSKATYGMLASLQFQTNSHDNAILIPTECILTDEENQYVYIVKSGKAAYTVIKTGLVGDGVTEVTSGLSGGETLVIKGQSYLSDGAEVRVVTGKEDTSTSGDTTEASK